MNVRTKILGSALPTTLLVSSAMLLYTLALLATSAQPFVRNVKTENRDSDVPTSAVKNAVRFSRKSAAAMCPTITDSLTVLRHVTCIGGTNGEFQFVGKGGVAPYSFTLGTLTGDVTNTSGYFNNLAPKDYRITVTDANGCTGTSIRTINSPTDFTYLNDNLTNLDWTVDSITTVGGGGVSYSYLPAGGSTLAALKPDGDSLAKYNVGNLNAISRFISIGFPFKIDNFYYDSLVVSEDGILSFNRFLNPNDVSSQWYENQFYKGAGTNPGTGDCNCDTAYLNNPLPFIAPFRDNIQANSTGAVPSRILYALSGTAPNRVFTVEWRNMRWHQVCNIQRDNAVSFQVELHEGTNKVRFRYKPEVNLKTNNCGDIPNVNGYDYSIGLFGRRLGPGNYLSINPDSTVLYSNGKVKTNNLTFPSAIGYNPGKHFELIPPSADPACPAPLSIVSLTATCSNGNNGMITITATGGLHPTNNSDRRYYYSKNGGSTYRRGTLAAAGTVYQDTFRNLAPGTYRIAVRDSTLQSFVIQTIEVPNATTTTLLVQPVTCNGGSDGQIRYRWSRSSPLGTYDLRFQKTGDAFQDFPGLTDTTRLFTGLSAGTYNVTVTHNDYGCTTTATQSLTDPALLTYTPAITQPVCPANATTGTKTGSVVLTAAGGVPDYTFDAPGGLTPSATSSTTRTYTNLAGGSYVFTVTDSRGCARTSEVVIANPTNYAINNLVAVNPLCSSGSTGSISLNVTGGSAATFTSIVFGGSTSSNVSKGATLSRTNLAAGAYNVSVTEGTCTYNVTPATTLTAPSNVVFISAPATGTSCFGGSNGQLELNVSGGTPPYMYSINNGANYQSSPIFPGLTAMGYILKAKDANTCFAVTSPTVSVPSPPVISFSTAKTDVTCPNVPGSITVTAGGGTGALRYSKDNGANYQTSNIFSNLTAGMYQVRVTDENNCTTTASNVTINGPGDCCPAAGTIWYVDAAAASGGTGTSWTCAFQNLQDAINAASSGHEVWVKAGTYKPTQNIFGATARERLFYLKSGVKIYGGFAGSETLLSQRNWVMNPTILSGDIGTAGDNSDNCYHVVLTVSDASSTELNGLSITDGNANGPSDAGVTVEGTSFLYKNSGGGIYCVNSSVTIANCIISGNSTSTIGGGAIIASTGGSPTLTNCLVAGNFANSSGGGLYINLNSPTINNCTFTSNSGGAISNTQNANTVLKNCLVWNNRVSGVTGSAAASIVNSSSTPVITYSLIQNQNPAGAGNINGIPNAADANYPQFVTPLDPATAPSTTGDFHLTACSPVLNLGTNSGAPATDLFGNARPFGATVDLGVHELQAAPTPVAATCQATTVQLDGAGNGTLTASALNNGSTGCAPLAFSASQTAFNCTHLGANTVMLTVTGANGSTGTCMATVTVADQVAPNALCRDFVKNLGTNGTATITPAEVNNLSNDNCGTVNLVSAMPNAFTCANIGANTVTLTVNDGHGNAQTCNATVTIADNTAPTAVCQSASVSLNSAGMATVTEAQINNGSSDNCGITSLVVAPASFTCANVGNQTVTLTVTDNAGQSANCTATVAVSDVTAPTAVCKNISVNLGTNGTVGITAAQINNGSSDNCDIANLSVSTGSFACANVGSQTVVLTATDNNGLSATCTATVTVTDAAPPTVVCQDITVNLDGAGNASITGAQVDGGSTDNCGIATRAVTPNTFTTANIGANTVTLTVTDNNGLSATCTATVMVTNNNLPNAVCQSYTAVLGPGGSATIVPANVDGGSTAVGGIASRSVSPNTLTCANLGANTVTLTVTGNNSLTATCNAAVTVQDNSAPTAVCKNATVILNSGGTGGITPSDVLNAGASSDNCGAVNAVSVSPNSFTCANIGANAVTLTVNDGNGNTATCAASVTVSDNTAPTAVCQNVSVNLSNGGTASITAAQVNNGSSDNCGTVNLVGVSPNSFTCANIGANTVLLAINDGHGNSATCSATVMVSDNLAPAALCRDIVVQLDGNGNAAITAAQINNGSSDNCALGTLSVSPNTFTLANVGINTVTLTVPDANGNSATCTAQVTVENNQLPNAVCQNIGVNLGSNGQVTITPNDVDGGSTALGGIANRSVSTTTLTCANLGANPVTLTVVGNNGQQASCNATVTVSDNTAPTATCQNVSVNLNSGETATITAAQVNNGSTDNCGTVNLVGVSPASFTCANLGANTVMLTMNDGNGNNAMCSATVTVNDPNNYCCAAPQALCQTTSVTLDAGGQATIPVSAVNNGSTYDCGLQTMAVSPAIATCANIGALTVTLTVTDAANQSSACTTTVTVSDNTAPTAVCQNVPVNLNSMGAASITAAQVNNGSSDNCGTVNLVGVSPGSFTCANLGANTVTLTVNDGNGNGATCSATVTVSDNTAPTAVCQNVPVNLNSAGAASITAAQINNGSSDNCGTVNLVGVSPGSFTCANLGANTVTLTVNDGHGNSATCSATVTVSDNTAPTAVCQNVSVNLNNMGAASITAAQVNNGSSDNCGTVNLAGVSPSSFTCANLGGNAVTLTINDGNGNGATCSATVTVTDNLAPTAVCQNVPVNLNSMGSASVTAAQVNNGSSDNCGTVNLVGVSPGTFTCANLGGNAVTLTINDGNGNSATCSATVTVSDNTAPMAVCKNASVNLNSGGTANVTAGQVNNGSSDNCGTANLVGVSPSSFTCADLGANTVTLTVNDGHGNSATCSATVTVNDIPPTALCKNATVTIQANEQATLVVGDIDNGSSDNCTLQNVMINQTTFTCANIGAVTVTLTATDGNGLTSTCTATVTVTDPNSYCCAAPTAICKPATIVLNGAGQATIPAAAVNNGSTYECGLQSMTVSPAAVNCVNVGTLTVTLTVSDLNNATNQCTATVTVQDNVAPVFTFVPANVTVQCNSVPAVGSPVASDNCGGAVSIAYNGQSSTPGACSDAYTLTRQWTATDASGNTKTATQRISVLDTQKPNFVSMPANITVQCSAIPAATTPTATDNCTASVVITYVGQTVTAGACANAYTLTRRWVASDNCSNTRSISQRITVIDNGKPTLTVPADMAIACSDPIPPLGTATASDGCAGSVTIAYLGQNTTSGACPGSYQIKRIWRATDACGNTTAATQTIQVSDNSAPVFVTIPGPITIECNQPLPALTNPTASDACGGYVHITFLGNVPSGSGCAADYTVTRSWRAQDLCGNTAMATQVIAVQGNNFGEEGAENRAEGTQLKTQNSKLETVNPNPTTDRIWIDLSEFAGEAVAVSIFSELGQLVWENRIPAVEDLQLSVSLREAGAAAGIYAVRVQSRGEVFLKRVVLVE